MPDDFSFIIDLVGNLGALGFIFWLVWRTTNHTIPRLASSFEDALKLQREDFKVVTAQERQDFHNHVVSHRDFFAAQMERERQVNSQQIDKLVEALKDLKFEVRRG